MRTDSSAPGRLEPSRSGSRGTVVVLKNITDLRHATEQVTQNVHRLQTAEEEIRLERDRLNLIMRSVPNPIILMDFENQPIFVPSKRKRTPATPARAEPNAIQGSCRLYRLKREAVFGKVLPQAVSVVCRGARGARRREQQAASVR